ncbi:hypothetical protein HXZ62_13325 [Empedobacter falsenii]|uniref:glycosyl hydrolase family 28-related protein n=1 Tax=Empedobacter TaxID=59734 RepID=UPI00257514B9|nr:MULTISPECIES: glycosyl hydrolase family 28-related protein [Empedobacter]MDM1063533.1 hypothetical protein [Empedobacter falsenii]
MKKNSKHFIAFLFLIVSFCSLAQSSEQFGVSIEKYGAKPAKNWQTAIDNSSAIQKAIDENPGRLIFIPSGIYLLGKEIKITHDVRLVGESKYLTILQPINNDGIYVNAGGVFLENFFIHGRGKTGITINNVRNTTITNVLLQNVQYGIKLVNAWNPKISNLDIDINNNQTPKVLKGIILSGQSVNNYITNSQISAVDVGIEIQKSDKKSEGLIISNVGIFSAKKGINSEGILSLHINNSIIDLCEEYALDIKNTAGLLVSNSWLNSKGSNNTQTIRLFSTWDSHFSTNNIKNGKGNAVILLE